ncbi:MAG: TIGR02099 family protein [Gammaproteobacteria bacterium]|nr:TIGR02099 family protein [Gammaproteobacteria bacterium]
MLRYFNPYKLLLISGFGIGLFILSLRCVLYWADQNPEKVTRYISEAVGQQVQIGHLSTHLHIFQPEIAAQDVVIMDDNNRALMQFNAARLRLRLLPLLIGQLKASTISADQARFTIKQTESGEFTVVGFDSEGNLLTSLIEQGRYQIINSSINLIDSSDHILSLDHINLGLNTSRNSFQLDTSLQLKGQPGKLRLIADFKTSQQTGHQLSGTFHIDSDSIHVSSIQGFLADIKPVEHAEASMKLWGYIDNSQLTSVYGHLGLDSLKWHNNAVIDSVANKLPSQLSSTIWLKNTPQKIQVVFNQLNLGPQLTLPEQNILIEHIKTGYQSQSLQNRIMISGLQIENTLPLAMQFADTQAIDQHVLTWLSNHNITGTLKNLYVSFTPQHSPESVALCSSFSKLSIDAKTIKHSDSILADNWSGHICMNAGQGQIKLDSSNASLYPTHLFNHPIKFSQIKGVVNWNKTAQGWFISSKPLHLDNQDLTMSINLNLETHATDPWLLDTDINFELIKANQLKYYLPSRQLNPKVSQWLANAFRAGSLTNGQFSYSGQLVESAFQRDKAVSTARLILENTSIQVDRNNLWPQIQNFNGDFHFKNGVASINVLSGTALGVNIKNGTIAAKDLTSLDNLLISTRLQADLEQVDTYVSESPLEEEIGDIVHRLQPTGDSLLSLDFMIPVFSDTDEFWIKGDIDLNNATVTAPGINMIVNEINGQLNFTEDSLSAEALDAMFNDQATAMSIINYPDSVQILASTRLDSDLLHQHWPWLKPLQGQTDSNFKVSVPKYGEASTPVRIKLLSNLKGMHVNLPEPLHKTTDQSKQLQVKFSVSDSDDIPIEIHYGQNSHAELNLLAKSSDDWHLDRAHLTIGNGLISSADSARFRFVADLPEWNLAEVKKLPDLISESEQNQTGHLPDNPLVPSMSLDINIDQLMVDNSALGSMDLHMTKLENHWTGQIQGSLANGTIDFSSQRKNSANKANPDTTEPGARLKLQFDSLNLPATDQLKQLDAIMSSRSITQLSPLSFPELDITVDHFRHGETSLGSLRLETSSLQNGLSIDQFMVTGAEHELNSTGNWLIQESHPVMALQGSLSSRNLAHFLHQFGIYEDIRKTSAMIDFDLDWQSSPIQIDWQSLNGSIQFKLEHGRLLGVEPGIGRALGLFSLNAWERRLRLDFSDVVDEGFAYDNVKADFVLKKGQAYSTNLAVDGVSARVNFVGRIGLHERDFEAAVTVIPRSSIALPLAGALGGPIGLGAGIVAQQIVGDQFETLSSSEYTVSGSWSHPLIKHVPENGGIFTRMLWNIQNMATTQKSKSAIH